MKQDQGTLRYITDQIRYICNTFKSRSGGSESERGCQAHFASELKDWSDSVDTEEFMLHPKAFMGWVIVAGVLALVSVALYWAWLLSGQLLFQMLSLVCVAAAIIMSVFEFLLYRKFTDFAYPKAQSGNVFARREPQGEVKQRIIFGGHADAAYEMTYILYRNAKSIYRVITGFFAGLVFLLVVNIISLFVAPGSGIWTALGLVALGFIPVFIASMFFINWRKVVDGANDNLTGCLVAMSVLRELAREDRRLQHTEVCCLITGGEEEGLRGATAFAKAHKEEFQDVETIFIALDTLREISQLKAYTRGINGTQKNSPYVADLLRAAAKGCGVELGDAGVYPGATDAEAFSREGLAACGLGGVNHIPQTYYHTRHDTCDNIDEGCIKLSLEICMEAVHIYDEQAVLQEECCAAGAVHTKAG